MATPFAKLRGAMVAQEVDRNLIARTLLISEATVCNRFRAVQPWTLDEQYALMDLLQIPYEQMHEFFPRNGQNEPGCTRLKLVNPKARRHA